MKPTIETLARLRLAAIHQKDNSKDLPCAERSLSRIIAAIVNAGYVEADAASYARIFIECAPYGSIMLSEAMTHQSFP